MKWNLVLVSTALAISVSCVAAGDLEDGDAAFQQKDYSTALKKYKNAAGKKDPIAQRKIGNMFKDGLGVAQNYDEAMRWYELSAKQGNVDAQFNLGAMHEGFENPKEAARWYQMAAKKGDVESQLKLGEFYFSGATGQLDDYHVNQNFKEALKWYRLAAKSFDKPRYVAHMRLAEMYSKGLGIKVDYVKAHQWASQSSNPIDMSEPNPEAVKLRDELAKKLNAQQIAKSDQMRTECDVSGYTAKSCD